MNHLRFVKPLVCLRLRPIACHRGLVYWGHNTIEEKEAAKKKEIESKLILQWTDPEQAVDLKKTTFYSPMRIKTEEEALNSGFSKARFNLADYYEFARQPILPSLFNRPHYGWKKRIKEYKKLIVTQAFVKDRLITLGPDLSAAHFLISRGCRIRFRGQQKWVSLVAFGFMPPPSVLPNFYDSGWYIEEIDASDSVIIYEGFQNLRNLIFLKTLDISYCPFVDAWVMDRITGEYQDSLEVLNISGCENLNWNGIECLWRFRKLKLLIMRDMDHVRDIKLICLMLLEIFPDLEIRGVDYMDKKLLEGTIHEKMFEELEQDMLLLPGESKLDEPQRSHLEQGDVNVSKPN